MPSESGWFMGRCMGQCVAQASTHKAGTSNVDVCFCSSTIHIHLALNSNWGFQASGEGTEHSILCSLNLLSRKHSPNNWLDSSDIKVCTAHSLS
ncbi:hypothetical protein XELAEV_18034036mg [Xenopus laevis]|uniref:Uncharacterized protein n=1 Tax=Xenopus laevis TaxID=8355 RepID=A0A974HEL1_XENLA|nr:hypothetical protein XELAEV_18034036mg [Xenopus laevis]